MMYTFVYFKIIRSMVDLEETSVENFSEIYENTVTQMASHLKALINSDPAKHIVLIANIQQWQNGLQPITTGRKTDYLNDYGFFIEQGGSEGPGWSCFADAVFQKMGFKQT